MPPQGALSPGHKQAERLYSPGTSTAFRYGWAKVSGTVPSALARYHANDVSLRKHHTHRVHVGVPPGAVSATNVYPLGTRTVSSAAAA